MKTIPFFFVNNIMIITETISEQEVLSILRNSIKDLSKIKNEKKIDEFYIKKIKGHKMWEITHRSPHSLFMTLTIDDNFQIIEKKIIFDC